MTEITTLVDRCRLGDDLAWETMVRRFQSRVYAVALHYLRDREEAKDAAQDVFVRIYGSLHAFDNAGDRFVPWMLSVARNACVDRLRRQKTRPAIPAAAVEDAPAAADPRPTAEEALLAEARTKLVRRAIDRLSDVSREMILLKDIQGLDLQEIAELLAVPLGTVKSRSARARIELARKVIALDPTYGA